MKTSKLVHTSESIDIKFLFCLQRHSNTTNPHRYRWFVAVVNATVTSSAGLSERILANCFFTNKQGVR